MLTIHGIKNCDVMQKAFIPIAIGRLDAHKMAYTFYDYKNSPPTESMVKAWLKQIPIETLVNTRSTTYKTLTDAQKLAVLNSTKCMAIIQENPSILKRPLLDVNGKFTVGFDEASWTKLLL